MTAPAPGPHRVPSSPVTLSGDGLVLRGYREADEPVLRRGFEDPVIQLWNPPTAGVDVGAWWRGRADWSSGGHASWAVTEELSGRLLGDVSLHEIDLDQGDAELGYTVLPGERGRGVARRAIAVASHFAFGELGLFRVQLYHAAENVASCNAAAAAGYVHEGTLRLSYRYGDGERHDEHLHARLASDPARG